MERQNIPGKTLKAFLFCIFIFFFLYYEGSGQIYHNSLAVKMNGYIINVGGRVLFQPCEDKTKKVWESLDNTSFPVWYFREDLYLEAIDNIGDSVKVNLYDSNDERNDQMKFSYFYCALEVNMMFLDTIKFKVYDKPKYKIAYNNNTYSMYGFDVDNRVQKIIPSEKKNLKLMYNFYVENGYSAPKWLCELIKKTK